MAALYLGFDFSTQQLKVTVIDDKLVLKYEDAVKFDTDLPEYGTNGGVYLNSEEQTATSPTLMWVKALDIVLSRLKSSNIDTSRILAISGSGQQHGSVYWKKGSEKLLQSLNSSKSLYENISASKSCFSIDNSPIWMDSSTTEQCKRLENAIGGAATLAQLTGSRAYERFTGSQIAKINDITPEALEETERIGLVSSFGATLLLGKYAPIDFADASGMNLMDINTKKWWQPCLDACAPNLQAKLGEPVATSSVLGSISNYFVDAYGFSPDCKVVAFTGDNPASLAGMRLKQNEIIVSLGTSDTLFLWLEKAAPALEGHVFCNPVDENAYMALLCYKNGSLQRERVRDACAEGSWETFERLLKATTIGNDGNIGIYYDEAEITPANARGTFRFNCNDETVTSFEKQTEIRAIIEGQFLAKRLHAEAMGLTTTQDSRILATGGASSSTAILQVISDVFNRPVFTLDIPNSAALGAAYIARYAVSRGSGRSFAESVQDAPDFKCAARPAPKASEVYDTMLGRFKQIENRHVRKVHL